MAGTFNNKIIDILSPVFTRKRHQTGHCKGKWHLTSWLHEVARTKIDSEVFDDFFKNKKARRFVEAPSSAHQI